MRCYMRSYRSRTHRKEPTYTYSEQQTALRNARAYVASLVKRGKITPQMCEGCPRQGLPHFPNPAKPREVVWLCRGHRNLRRQAEERERRDFAERASTAVKKVKWDMLRARFDSEWPTLNNEQRDAVKALARKDPRVKDIPLESPLARQALIKAFGEWDGQS